MEHSTSADLQLLQVSSSNTALEIQVIILAVCARIFTSSYKVITTVKICNKIGPAGAWIWTTLGGDIWVVLSAIEAIPFPEFMLLRSYTSYLVSNPDFSFKR